MTHYDSLSYPTNATATLRAPCASSTFCFAEFELDAKLYELRRNGQRLPVQPKVLELLFYLVKHRDRAIPATELRRALWPAETVCSASLRRAVRALRAVLGDTGSSQSSILTLRGFGYRFVVPVELSPEPEQRVGNTAGYLLPQRMRALRGSLRSLPHRRPSFSRRRFF